MMSKSEPRVPGVLATEPARPTRAGGTTQLARRPRPGGRGKDDHRAAAEAEAAATATAIARLCWRISRPGVLEHPAVMRELGKLEQQLTVQLDSQAGRTPGRHRSPVGKAPGSDGS
jgi:hypothetical protein